MYKGMYQKNNPRSVANTASQRVCTLYTWRFLYKNGAKMYVYTVHVYAWRCWNRCNYWIRSDCQILEMYKITSLMYIVLVLLYHCGEP